MRSTPGAPGNFMSSSSVSDTNLIKIGGTAISLGQTTMAGSIPVVLASDQSAVPVSLSGSVAVTQSGVWDEVGINDSNNSLTVDAPVGTPVFVRLSDGASAISTLPVSLASVPSHNVTNVGTFAVQAAQSGVWNIADISGTISLPTGAATSAKQDTIIGHVDGIEGLLTTIDADTGNISTKIDTIAGAISSSKMQVDVITMPTVTVDTEFATAALIADGTAVPSTPKVQAFPMTFDGSNWNMIRSIAAVSDSAGFDVQAAGLVAQLDDVSTGTVTENNFGKLRMSSRRALLVEGVASGTAITVDSELPAAATVTTAMAAPTAPAVGSFILGRDYSGGNWYPLRVDTNGIPDTYAVGGGGVKLQQGSSSDGYALNVGGGVAHDGGDAGNPIKMGFKAESSPKGITLVADGDRTDGYADLDGLQMVKLNTSYADIISERVTDTGGTSTAFTNFSAVANTKNYVTSISLFNSSATAGYVDFRSGTGGSVLWTMAIPAGGGSIISSAVPLFATAANTALAYDVSGALTTVYISVSGFQSKV